MEIMYIFRKPKFPLILNIGNYVFSSTEKELHNKLLKANPKKDEYYDTLDSTGEGFMAALYDHGFVISPLTTKKKWTKKEIISIYNNRSNKHNDIPYSEKSLSAKTKQRILNDITKLLNS